MKIWTYKWKIKILKFDFGQILSPKTLYVDQFFFFVHSLLKDNYKCELFAKLRERPGHNPPPTSPPPPEGLADDRWWKVEESVKPLFSWKMGQRLSCGASQENGLFSAVQVGDFETVEALLKSEPNLLHQTTVYDRNSALHIAAANGQIEVGCPLGGFWRLLFFGLSLVLFSFFTVILGCWIHSWFHSVDVKNFFFVVGRFCLCFWRNPWTRT